MNGSIHDYARVGIVHFMAYPACAGGEGPVLESIHRLANDTYFDVIELTRVKDNGARAAVRAIAEQARVDLCFGAQPILLGGGFDLNHADDTERRKAIDAVKAGVDQAEELGCKGVAVLSGKATGDTEGAMLLLIDSLKQLAGYAKSKGMPLVLETFDQVPFGKNCLIGPNADAVVVSKEVRKEYPDFGIMLDLSHLPLQFEASAEAIATAGAHLVHAHIGNCAMDDPTHPAYGDNHPRFGAPGGRNDIAELTEYLRALLASGYLSTTVRRVLSFEVKPMQGEDAEAVIAGSKRTLDAAWRRV
ncbi:MAG TPA: TIM barrel protein [Candidatus Hydrogenedentes bacterium]|nr:TIM barrel protein [Candidatus Hydrogenedentota bacterium]HRK36032.1 TIM barrel protein [Candidatus Hydrogenedentota bacterium]